MHSTIDIDGITMHYDVQGSGPAIIMMHGWGCRASTLQTLADVASATNTVYSIDFPGFGDTPEPPAVWGVEEYTRFIEKFVDKLGIEKPSLLGHSFGGRVGILYASRRPVEKLVLVDAAGIKPRRKLSYYIKVYSFKMNKFLTLLMHGREKGLKIIEEQRNKRGSADYRNASQRMKAVLSKTVNEDLTPVLSLIKAPTLLIWGENDTATPMRDARIMEKEIPDAGLVSYPGCGHYSFLDNRAQTAAVLHSFLTSK